MTRMSFASHPYLLGFDQLDRLLERSAKNGEGYPPFNIEQRGDNAWRISLAVAGFAETDLSVTVEDRQLVIRGRQAEEAEKERVFLHRGIATRQFQRSFVLADGVEVAGAHMDCGLLHVDLERAAPEAVVKTIQINGRGQNGAA
jgi:HSP20 family molecular chaperone IbpA